MLHPDSPPDVPSHRSLAAPASDARTGAELRARLHVHHRFRMPHRVGGPGAGPMAVREHLVPYLRAHPLHPDPAPREGAGRNTAAHPLTTAGRNNCRPLVRRIDGAHGDRDPVCSRLPIDACES
ncbi:hypothetical protein RM550_16690 [Streptomyces sp. DSM 41527]|uniref:Uncharacterized protein n=1 Tax=Streptomyces mooreae TaxID=3075523 RepID=A0ABU2T8V0_9ACTN|nr:hypothetical protein [Streptomyces sp. DSM 41527]MDT0457357.1 hypothetical protein [Streptomyces sp. DSM 41527]